MPSPKRIHIGSSQLLLLSHRNLSETLESKGDATHIKESSSVCQANGQYRLSQNVMAGRSWLTASRRL